MKNNRIKNISIEKLQYTFKPYKTIYISNTPSEIDNRLCINKEIWTWPKAGRMYSLDWTKKNLPNNLKELFKGFLFYRFQNISSTSIYSMDLSLINFLCKKKSLHTLPWQEDTIVDAFTGTNYKKLIILKIFYEWCYSNGINSFNKKGLTFLQEYKYPKGISYKRIRLRETYLEDNIVSKILERLKQNENQISDFSLQELQKHVIIRLCWELAPRPSQIYFLNFEDLLIMKNHQSNKKYYSLDLPMSKKLGQISNGKRIRRISSILGRELELLISETKKISPPTNAMFVTSYNNHVRCPCHIINRILIESFSFVNLGSIELRHHLAQSFADDGAPIEIIAEILGHNTLIASKAYIKATPKIAEIKTKALGKFEPYRKIINMLLTGEIINKPQSFEKNWVQGIVGMDYIGEIGKCNLQQLCPKNPIYSCYTCKKFHPFKDGEHDKVLKALEKHVQLFIDIGLKRNDIKNNRTVIQLREIITSVKTVIQIISQNEQINT